MSGILLVWDFDWSLVDNNSDPWVIQQVGASDIFNRLDLQNLEWTDLMDQTFLHAHKELGLAESDIRKASHTVPMHENVQKVIEHFGMMANCDMLILSDANSIFIEEILAFRGLKKFFREVHTNEGVFEEGALRVRPYHSSLHNCDKCPPNLCKGKVLESILNGANYEMVAYVGDGGGDFCPCTKLSANDLILSREFYPGKEDRKCPLLRRLMEHNYTVKASIDILNGSEFWGREKNGKINESNAINESNGKEGAVVVTWNSHEQLAEILFKLSAFLADGS